jgi:hypothetical protein
MFMQDVIQSMTMFMELRGFAPSTQRTYVAHMKRFYAFCGKHPASTGYDEVRAFLHQAIKERKLSSAYNGMGIQKRFGKARIVRLYALKRSFLFLSVYFLRCSVGSFLHY